MYFLQKNTQVWSNSTMKKRSTLFVFILFFASYSIAGEAINLIKPTGKWYTVAHYEWPDSDACGSDASSIHFEYENLSPSFEEAKKQSTIKIIGVASVPKLFLSDHINLKIGLGFFIGNGNV